MIKRGFRCFIFEKCHIFVNYLLNLKKAPTKKLWQFKVTFFFYQSAFIFSLFNFKIKFTYITLNHQTHLIVYRNLCAQFLHEPYTNNSLQLWDVLQYFVEDLLLKQYRSVLFKKLVIFSDFVKKKKKKVWFHRYLLKNNFIKFIIEMVHQTKRLLKYN